MVRGELVKVGGGGERARDVGRDGLADERREVEAALSPGELREVFHARGHERLDQHGLAAERARGELDGHDDASALRLEHVRNGERPHAEKPRVFVQAVLSGTLKGAFWVKKPEGAEGIGWRELYHLRFAPNLRAESIAARSVEHLARACDDRNERTEHA